MRAALLLLLCLLPGLSAAEVYRWTDKDGVVHYTDKPPTRDAKPAQLPPLQTISGGMGAGAAGFGSSPAQNVQAGAAPAFGLSIISPRGEETLRDASREVTVSVALRQPLPEGGGLIYYLDGNAQNVPAIQSLSYTMGEVERGAHVLSVAAVDGAGKEIGRSPPVIVHLKPPTAK